MTHIPLHRDGRQRKHGVTNDPPQQCTHQNQTKDHHEQDTCDIHQSNIQSNWGLVAHTHGIACFHCVATPFGESKHALAKICKQSFGYEIPAASADMGTSE